MAEEVEDGFPGLNKKHGFYRIIERNQESRDEYHKVHEAWKEEKRKEQDAEVLSKRHSMQRKSRNDRRPDRQVYVPPGSTSRRQQQFQDGAVINTMKKSPLYRIEIEVLPNVVWRKDILQLGQDKQLAYRAATDYHLDKDKEYVLRDIIKEFEMKLKVDTS